MKSGKVEVSRKHFRSDWYKSFCKEFVPMSIKSREFGRSFEIACISEHFEEVEEGCYSPLYEVSMKDGFFTVENITKREINDEISRLKKKIENYEKIINTSIIFKKDEVLRDWSTQFERTIVLKNKS